MDMESMITIKSGDFLFGSDNGSDFTKPARNILC